MTRPWNKSLDNVHIKLQVIVLPTKTGLHTKMTTILLFFVLCVVSVSKSLSLLLSLTTVYVGVFCFHAVRLSVTFWFQSDQDLHCPFIELLPRIVYTITKYMYIKVLDRAMYLH